MAPRKKTTRRKTTSSRSKPKTTRRKSTSTRAKSTSTRKKSTRSTKTSARSTAARKKSSTRTQATPPPRLVSRLTLDQKLDITGVLMTLIGLLVLLSFLSANRSSLTEGAIAGLQSVFGWGSFFFPLGLIAIGLWLVLRNFERIPRFAAERVIGFSVLYINLLTILHFLLFPESAEQGLQYALAGMGGGRIGNGINEFLLNNFGYAGSIIALLAWMLIGLTISLDVSVTDLFRWLPPLVEVFHERMRFLYDQLVQRRTAHPDLPGAPVSHSEAIMATISPTGETITSADFSMPTQGWLLPKMEDVLDKGQDVAYNDEFDRMNARVIEETLASFGAPASVVEIKHGPTITQFGVEPSFVETRNGRTRVRVNKIASLADDLALALAASTIRIQAPVPGAGYIGIEVPNEHVAMVTLRDVVESDSFKKMPPPLRFALGQDVSGAPIAANLAAMPHLLIAGATGSGKSVCVNGIIAAFLAHNTPDELRMIMVDPKRVELTGYNGIPHLLSPVVVEMERVVGALQWVTREMDARYQKFSDTKTRNISDYNQRMVREGNKKLPYLVVIIDELADLMLLAPDQTEKSITRLAQLARATGIHLIIATQRPSVDVVTGLIKANFPARIAFAVASGVDSRVILDQPGADRLLGRGDMLFQSPDAPEPVRLQGVFVSDEEVLRLVQFWRMQAVPTPGTTFHTSRPADMPAPSIPLKQTEIWEEMKDLKEEQDLDPLFHEAVDLIRRQGRASVSMLQRRMRIGYTRAARMVDVMEEKGIVGPPEGGAQTREVLDYGGAAPPVD